MPEPPSRAASIDERRALVVRICSSPTFARTVRLREFLQYITTLALEGRAEQLTETHIARHVFARGDEFVPVDDSVVRSSARQLRLKLKEYFDAEGRDESWRIDVPKGSYVPVFTRLDAPPGGGPHTEAAISKRFRLSLAVNLLLLCALLLIGLWDRFAPAAAPDSVVRVFLKSASGGVPIVVSDFSLAAMKYLFADQQGKAMGLDDYVAWDYSGLRPRDDAPATEARAFELLRGHRLTRSGDLSLAVRILQAGGLDRRLNVRHARDVAPRELRSASHIILGNPNSTPWAEPYEARLGFRWLRGVGYEDLFPGPGEPSVYRIQGSSFVERGTGYGRLAVLPNLSGHGQVLLLSGVNMVTMEAAGEAATDPAIWAELQNRLGISPSHPLPAFEALLRTEAVDNTPQHAQIVKARLIRK